MGKSRFVHFFTEMRRRRVFRMMGVYIVGAFAVLQAADLALPALGLQSEAIGIVWVGVILGFPIAIVLGWLYDIDDGRVIRVTGTDKAADLSLQRIDYLILSALGVIGTGLVLGLASELKNEGVVDAPAAVSHQLSDNSIAVLPFDDTSFDHKASAAIALGLQDGLLTRLSKIGGLKVISKTSVERYRDSTLSIPEMGLELGVANILEGSVQVSNNKLRVNAQLIDAATDEHRWAEEYDRNLTATDIFDIQSEIVTEVVRKISTELSARENSKFRKRPTENLDAYTHYLKGKSEFEKFAEGSNESAIGHFEAAIAQDPEFALAYVGLAGALLESGREFRIELAEIPLAKSFELDGDSGEGYVVLGTIEQIRDNYLAAEDAYRTAMNLEPGNSRAYQYLAKLRWAQDRDVEALTLMQQAFSLNPNSAGINYEIGLLYDRFGRFDEAMSAYRRAVKLEPDRYYVETFVAAYHYLGHGEVDEAIYWYHKGVARKQLPSGGEAAAGIAHLELGDPVSASLLIEHGRALNPTGFWPLFASLLHSAHIGNKEKIHGDAMALLDAIPGAQPGLRFLRNGDLAAGRYEAARRRYQRAHPELFAAEPEVTRDNYKPAVDLAKVLLLLGEDELANLLLDRALVVIADLPRLGNFGFWVTDAQIHALRGDTTTALNALATAVAEGWRIKTWYHFDQNPNFDSIREHSEFQRLRKVINDDLTRQAQHVAELTASGDIIDLATALGAHR